MRPFTTLAAALFALLSVLQLTRFLLNWEVTVNGFAIPVWASAVVCLLAAGLAAMLWRENSQRAV